MSFTTSTHTKSWWPSWELTDTCELKILISESWALVRKNVLLDTCTHKQKLPLVLMRLSSHRTQVTSHTTHKCLSTVVVSTGTTKTQVFRKWTYLLYTAHLGSWCHWYPRAQEHVRQRMRENDRQMHHLISTARHGVTVTRNIWGCKIKEYSAIDAYTRTQRLDPSFWRTFLST